MKLLSHLRGLLLIVKLAVSLAAADISPNQNTQYLSPFGNTQSSSAGHKFEVAKYGNSNYQQFEVHKPIASNQIHIEHINAPPGFQLNNPDFGASLLKVASDELSNQIVVKHENAANHFPSNYRHDFPQQLSENFASHQNVKSPELEPHFALNQAGSEFLQSSKYLPPIQSKQYSQQVFDTPEQETTPPATSLPESGSQDLSQLKIEEPQAIAFKGSQYYLPLEDPIKDETVRPTLSQVREEIDNNKGYLPPQQTKKNEDSLSIKKPFRAPGYLPPPRSSEASQQNSIQSSSQGSEHLPSPQQQQQQQLLQQQLQQQQQRQQQLQQQRQQQQQQQQQLQLQEQQQQQQQLQLQEQQQQQQQRQQQQHQLSLPHIPINDPAVKAPGFLPPGYDFEKPLNAEAAIAELHKLPDDSNDSPNQEQNQQSQSVSVQSNIQVSDSQKPADLVFGTPKQANGLSLLGQFLPQSVSFVPQGYEYKSPEYTLNAAQQIEFGREHRTFRPSDYLPPTHLDTNAKQHQHQQQSQAHTSNSQNYQSELQNLGQQQRFAAPGYLPPLNNVNSGLNSVLNLAAAPSQFALRSLPLTRGTAYFAPTRSQYSQQSSQPSDNTFRAPEYLPPTQTDIETTESFEGLGLGYLPAERPSYYNTIDDGQQLRSQQLSLNRPQSQSLPSYHMRPLSSYMNSVEPYERYGSARKAFPKYGPPSSDDYESPVITEVAPMYKEVTKRPKSYAPSMSYIDNAVNATVGHFLHHHHHHGHHFHKHIITQLASFSQHVLKALQSLMPQDTQQQQQQSKEADNSASTSSRLSNPAEFDPYDVAAKVRTVQIVNPNEVKTLQVLESVDDGVKTIKILGPANKIPTGPHRVINVVSGDKQTVQTVKIYNDHEDYASIRSPPFNQYAIPSDKRSSKKSSKRARQRLTTSH